jgi:hemerythrin-like domain-containing protein
MRTPLETWVQDHRNAISQADRLVELLSPNDIQERIAGTGKIELRIRVADYLEAFVHLEEGHFRYEENYLVPAIKKHFGDRVQSIIEALGCMIREHVEMHKFAERIRIFLPQLKSDVKLESAIAGDILRVAYGVQSLLRHHFAMEEREIYPLVGKLPMQLVEEILDAIPSADRLHIDHLIKPLGNNVEDVRYKGENGEGPEN